MLTNNQRLVVSLWNIYITSKLIYEWSSKVIQDVRPSEELIMYSNIINKPTLNIVLDGRHKRRHNCTVYDQMDT